MSSVTRLALAAVLAIGVAACDDAAQPSATPPGGGLVAIAPCTPIDLRGPDGNQIDLSGTWSGNDGGRYFLKQLDSCVWWSGLSDFAGQALGEEWIMTFRGNLDTDGRLVGDFVDVKGTNPGAGTMTIRVQAEQRDGQLVVELHREEVIGHQIGVTFWQRISAEPASPDPASPSPPGSPDESPPASPTDATISPDATTSPVTLPPG